MNTPARYAIYAIAYPFAAAFLAVMVVAGVMAVIVATLWWVTEPK